MRAARLAEPFVPPVAEVASGIWTAGADSGGETLRGECRVRVNPLEIKEIGAPQGAASPLLSPSPECLNLVER